jgi:GWxTD domain-containing protein
MTRSTLRHVPRTATRGFLLALVACAFPEALVAQGEVPSTERSDLEAVLLRTWSGDDVTMVDGLAHVPLSMLAASTTGVYRFELTVIGDDGTQLYRDGWERTVSERAAAFADVEASTMLESFRFGVKPGHYDVQLRAYPTDAADLGVTRVLTVEGFVGEPVASDLILADHLEPLNPEGGGSWSLTHGGFGISAVAKTTLLPREPRLFYYVELYGDSTTETSFDVRAVVLGSGGEKVYETPTAKVVVAPGGVPYAGNLSLAGLPPGDYELQLEMSAEGGDGSTTSRRSPFRMLEHAAGPEAGAGSPESEYFAALSEAELNATFGGVGYLVSDGERQVYESLPLDARRRYLAAFFADRDPTPGTAGNRVLEEYVERVGSVRSKYGELVGTRERLPWTTDAGKLLLRYGEPDRRHVNQYPSGADTSPTAGGGGLQGEVPYEIWAYHTTGHVYLFVQESQFGVWRMIFATDPDMPRLADWSRRVGPQALRDMANQFGIQPR